MFSYIRSWWLINRIARLCLLGRVEVRDKYPADQDGVYFGPTPILERFLENRSMKYWFGIAKHLPFYKKGVRIEKDRKLIQRSNNLGLTQTAKSKDGLLISVMPEGYYFARPMNGFAGFLKEFREVYITITAMLVFLSGLVWSPGIKEWILGLFR